MSHCLNCQHQISEQDKFCANCGQPTYDLQQSLVKIIHKIGHELLDIDGRVMRTLKTLVLKPGVLSAKYRDGKRVSFTPPLRMYLVTSVLLFFITSLLKTPTEGTNIQIAFMLLPAQLLEQLPKLMFILLPVYALILQILHPRTHYIFNLVFTVHSHIFTYLLLMLLLPLYSLDSQSIFIAGAKISLIAYLFCYPVVAIKAFYSRGWLKSFVVASISSLTYLVLMGAVFELALMIAREFK